MKMRLPLNTPPETSASMMLVSTYDFIKQLTQLAAEQLHLTADLLLL
jgi:hypothetical protein